MGVDVLSVTDVFDSLERFGDRYIQRIFTPREAEYCRTAAGRARAERFAARFAAKEAVLKALQPDQSAIPWRSIEVRRHASGWCDVVLHGAAASLAERDGIQTIALSMSHHADCAVAVAVAQRAGRRCGES